MTVATLRAKMRRITRLKCHFSLRTLFLVVTIASLSVGLICRPVLERIDRVNSIVRHGAQIDYVDSTASSPTWKRIVGAILGEASVFDVECVYFGGWAIDDSLSFQITDNQLVHLSTFPCLRRLDLTGTKVSDTGMDLVAGLTNLEVLILDRTALSDAGLVKLEKLSRLRRISVIDTGVTPAAIQQFSTLHPDCDVRWMHHVREEVRPAEAWSVDVTLVP